MSFRTEDVERLLTATGRMCCICRSLHNVQVHHIVPMQDGGSDNIENAIPICPSCHDRVHVRPSPGRSTRDYSPDELKLHRNRMIAECRGRARSTETEQQPRPKAEPRMETTSVEATGIQELALSPSAKADCRKMGIKSKDALSFVEGEASRHPLMFHRAFTSLPLIFGDNVLLLSWDCRTARIERILTRQGAYPLNDAWAMCLGLYRKATLLPYRTQETGRLLTSSDAKLAVAVFRRLVDKTQTFIRDIEKQTSSQIKSSVDMQLFLDEAQFALVNADVGTAVARLEAVLSTVHKLILRYAPQGIGGTQVSTTEPPKADTQKPGMKSVLLVDDEQEMLWLLKNILQREGYQCFTATCSREALQLLVDRDFDLIITDLMMPDTDGLNVTMDGRELVLAAKKSGSRAKIAVLTGYMSMAEHASVGSEAFPCDSFLVKPFDVRDTLKIIKELLDARDASERENSERPTTA